MICLGIFVCGGPGAHAAVLRLHLCGEAILHGSSTVVDCVDAGRGSGFALAKPRPSTEHSSLPYESMHYYDILLRSCQARRPHWISAAKSLVHHMLFSAPYIHLLFNFRSFSTYELFALNITYHESRANIRRGRFSSRQPS